MFANDLPYDVLPSVLDVFLVEGNKGLLRVALSLLSIMENTLLEIKSSDEIMEFLSHASKREKVYADVDQFTLFTNATSFYINNVLLKEL